MKDSRKYTIEEITEDYYLITKIKEVNEIDKQYMVDLAENYCPCSDFRFQPKHIKIKYLFRHLKMAKGMV